MRPQPYAYQDTSTGAVVIAYQGTFLDGSSFGAQLAGARITRGIDAWDLATRTFKDNFAGAAIETREQPIAMHAGMPVETAEEDGMQRARTRHVLRPGHHMIELVRPFAPDMAKRRAREMRSELFGEI